MGILTDKSGALAQLGERLHGMQEVVSSNLIGSISYLLAIKGFVSSNLHVICPGQYHFQLDSFVL